MQNFFARALGSKIMVLGLLGACVFAIFVALKKDAVRALVTDAGAFDEQAKPGSNRLHYRPCDSYSADNIAQRCYFYRTHERGGFYLPMTVIQPPPEQGSDLGNKKRDLLVQIPGGPGQGFMTREAEISFWREQIEEYQWDFDILLYDPRGTGDGKFSWRCEALLAQIQLLFGRDISLEEEYKAMFEALRQCRKQFEVQLRPQLLPLARGPGADDVTGLAELYTDVFSAAAQRRDIAGMIEALGYDRAHLYGSSYGTRVALLAADLPQVKTLMLDAAYRFEDGLFSQEPQLLAQMFEFHEALYMQWPGRVGSFASLYAKAADRLKVQAVEFDVAHFYSGKKIAYVLTPERLVDIAFSTLYRNDMYGAFYAGLSSFVAQGEVGEEFERVVASYVDSAYDESFSTMVFFSSECADNQREEAGVLAASFAAMSSAMLTTMPEFSRSFDLAMKYDACKIFPSRQREVVQGKSYADKPTLIFSGQYDPVTPASHGQLLAAKLPRARHIEIKNAGHGVLFGGYCDLSFVQAFTQSASLDIDIACQDALLWQ